MARRVANFLPHYPTPGGTTNAVRGLSRALVRAGWDAIIYCYRQPGPPAEYESTDGVRIVRFGASSRLNPFQVDSYFLDHLSSNKDKIDLLVLHGMFSPGNLKVGEVARLAGIPYVVCPHDPYHPSLLRKSRWKKLVYGSLFERRFLNASSGIQLLAKDHRKYLLDYGVYCPSFVVPNGFDPSEFANGDLNQSVSPICPQGKPALLHLGRLDMHHKGLDLLLKGLAVGLVDGKLPSTTILDFIGSDWGDQRKLESLVRQLGIQPNVRFLGRIANRSSATIIAPYGLVILPSRFDGFGLAALEAMVVGKPVVLSEEAGIASFVRDAGCGYLVKPEVASICAGLVRAVDTTEQWAGKGQKGREFAYAHLTWDKSAAQATNAYEAILSGSTIPVGSLVDEGERADVAAS